MGARARLRAAAIRKKQEGREAEKIFPAFLACRSFSSAGIKYFLTESLLTNCPKRIKV